MATTDSKTSKTPQRSKSQRAEQKLTGAQAGVDKLSKRIDAVEGKREELTEQHAQLVREHREASARRDHALSNPDLSDEARAAGTPGPLDASAPQSTIRDEPSTPPTVEDPPTGVPYE